MCQRKYALQLLEDYGYLHCKPTVTPMDPKVNFHSEDSELLEDSSSYRKLIGRLLYLTISRPDICFAVHKLSQFLASPTRLHLMAAHHNLQVKAYFSQQNILFN